MRSPPRHDRVMPLPAGGAQRPRRFVRVRCPRFHRAWPRRPSRSTRSAS
jgi:hypothetical protein